MHRKAMQVSSMRRMSVLFFSVHYLIFVLGKVVSQKFHLQSFIPLNNAEFHRYFKPKVCLQQVAEKSPVLPTPLGRPVPWWVPKYLFPDMGENNKKHTKKAPKRNKIKGIQ